MTKQYFYLLIIIALTTACGFTVVDKSSFINFNIVDITTSGEKKINYKIKNKLFSFSQSNEKKQLKIEIDSNKEKRIKEKDIKNEITKYEIDILVKITFYEINSSSKIKEFSVRKEGEYNVVSQHSQTLNNEKKLIEILVDDLADQIFFEIGTRADDL